MFFKTAFIMLGVYLPVLTAPPIVFVFDGIVINGNFLIASVLGWCFGWILNPQLTFRQVLGGLVVAVVVTLYVGEGIQTITENTFLQSEKLNGFIIFLLNAAGIPLWERTLDVIKTELPERLRRWFGGDK